MLAWLPVYMKHELSLSDAEISLSALPYLCQVGCSIYGGVFADHLLASGFGLLAIRRGMTVLSLIVPGLLLCCLGVGLLNPMGEIVVMSLSLSLSTLLQSGALVHLLKDPCYCTHS